MWIKRRWLIGGVTASILLNVFLLGIVGGHVLPGKGVSVARGVGNGPVVPPAHVRALPPDEKKTFAAAMKSHRDGIREARRALREARAAVEADIAAPVFDRARVTADFVALRERNMAVQEAVNNALVDALADLSPTSRAALVDHVGPERANP